MRWSENETCKFVKLYLNNEFLWNVDHPCYKSKVKRLEAYKKLTAQFKAATGILLNEAEVKIKIKNLRSTYSQELAKIIQRSGPEYAYKPTIKWFSEWHKCFKNTTRKKIDDTQFDEENANEDDSENIWVSEGIANLNEDTDGDPFVSQPDDDYGFILKSEPEDVQQKRKDEDAYKRKRKKIKCNSPSTDQSDVTFRGSMDYTTHTASKEDEFDIYGKYIASQLRQMELQKALRLQLEIQSLVSEARISELSNKN